MALLSRRSDRKDTGPSVFRAGELTHEDRWRFEQKRWRLEAAEGFARATELVPDSAYSRLSCGAALGNAGRAGGALDVAPA